MNIINIPTSFWVSREDELGYHSLYWERQSRFTNTQSMKWPFFLPFSKKKESSKLQYPCGVTQELITTELITKVPPKFQKCWNTSMSSWDVLKRQRSRSLAGILAACGWFGDVRCQCVPAYQTRLWAEADGMEACSLWTKVILIHSERADWQHLYHSNHDCLQDGCKRKTRAE